MRSLMRSTLHKSIICTFSFIKRSEQTDVVGYNVVIYFVFIKKADNMVDFLNSFQDTNLNKA